MQKEEASFFLKFTEVTTVCAALSKKTAEKLLNEGKIIPVETKWNERGKTKIRKDMYKPTPFGLLELKKLLIQRIEML